MIHDGSPGEEKPWGCFHLSDKSGERVPCLHEHTFDGQRTASGNAARLGIRREKAIIVDF